MAEERVQRRLAAILAADVVGYSRLMEQDGAGTLSRLKAIRREIFEPKTKEHGGRIFKTMGDGALVEFTSVSGAVRCAIDIQKAVASEGARNSEKEPIEVRIGISLGDVIVEGSDLYGNGVNIAARLEALAEPGGICISGNVQEHVKNDDEFSLQDLGSCNVKNIAEPMKLYQVNVQTDQP
ncbi:MAG: adenylate/guanylate cyclase domain-containing protein, partial [Rhodospirillales bacterium]|nr:adenylate/guanylate cyclase domain-containing protein [Rhodospirillales bacterium]